MNLLLLTIVALFGSACPFTVFFGRERNGICEKEHSIIYNSLDGNDIFPASVYDGTGGEGNDQIAAKRAKISGNDRIDKKEDDIRKKEDDIRKKEDRIDKKEDDIREMRKDIRKKEDDIRKEVDSTKKDELIDELSVYKREKDNMLEALDGLQKEKIALLGDLSVQKKSKEVLNVELSELKEEKNALVEESSRGNKPFRFTDFARITDINFRLNEPLRTFLDLDLLRERVLDLFKWFNTENQQYLAPYFVAVQSSGMGKTRLLKALRDDFQNRTKDTGNFDFECRLVLCARKAGDVKAHVRADFDHILEIPIYEDHTEDPDEARTKLTDQLDKILQECDQTNVVLLIDEAQALIKSNEQTWEAAMFRVVRWYLRRKDHVGKKQVAAVLTGTTSSLFEWYKDSPSSTFTRDSNFEYVVSGKNLYPPFFQFCTIGIFADRTDDSDEKGKGEFEIALPYGRPLFALLNKGAPPTENQTSGILTRMLLSKRAWELNDASCLSIIGSRFQIKGLPFEYTSDLIARGYGCLFEFRNPLEEGRPSASLVFYPDPVVSWLAMALFREDWRFKQFQGRSPSFWTNRLRETVSNQVCSMNKGDIGEVGAAMYLTFTADSLRVFEEERAFSPFRVSFESWCEALGAQHKTDHEMDEVALEKFAVDISKSEQWEKVMSMAGETQQCCLDPSTNLNEDSASISVMQFFRLYANVTTSLVGNQDFLRARFNSGVALYMAPQCRDFDLAIPFRYPSNVREGYDFGAILVSVKSSKEFAAAAALKECAKMYEAMESSGLKNGLGILLLPALERRSKYPSELLLKKEDAQEATRRIIVRVVVVPAADPFAIKRLILESTSVGEGLARATAFHPIADLGLSGLDPDYLCQSDSNKKVLDQSKKIRGELRRARKYPEDKLNVCLEDRNQ